MNRVLKAVVAVVAMLAAGAIAAPAPAKPVSVDTTAHAIEFRAIYRPDQFNSNTGLREHHFVAWAGGKASRLALLVALSADSAIHDALLAAGAAPGNNLTIDSWDKRADPSSKDPDIIATGSPLEITINAGEHAWTPESLLTDLNGRPEDFVFAGNRQFIPVWKSGCVVCLQSCPGSKVSIRSYTMRDLYRGTPHFAPRRIAQLVQGDTVTVRMKVLGRP
jgi:hypothetical protein